MTSSQVTVGSGDHHVLALHGWFGSARGWGGLPQYLDGSKYTYVFMDLRGYGDRKQAAGEFDELVARLLERVANRDQRPRWKDSSFFKRFAQ